MDASRITATWDTNALALSVQGTDGAVEAGASVFVRDSENRTAWAVSNQFGEFTITQFPAGFITTPGESLAVTQSSPGHSEGPASSITIVAI